MTAAILATGAAESCSNPGGGTFTLLGPISAVRRRFRDDSRVSSGRQVWYCATDGTQTEWGVGTLTVGTNGASDTLSRDTVTETTAGNTNKLNFTGNLTVFSSDNAWSHPMKDASGVAWSGPGNDDRVKTASTVAQIPFSLPDTDGFRTTSVAVTRQDIVAVAPSLRFDLKAVLSFASAYSAGPNDYAQATLTVQLYQLDANGNAGSALVTVSDIGVCTATQFAKLVCFLVATGLTPGVTYSVRAFVAVTASPSGSSPAGRLSATAAVAVML